MAYTIDKNICTICKKCDSICPINAISVDSNTGKYVINEKICDSCNICPSVCPVNAISKVN